jgi:putative methionine-R-sulfoxide reductase with GAF domain
MVVDCFDALTSDRPYRPRFGAAAARQLIVERRGTMYDPRVVDVFLTLHDAGVNEVAPETRAPVADPHATPAPVTADAEALPRELAAFYTLGRELASPRNGSEVGQAIWASLRSEIGAAACVLFVYDEDSDALAPMFRAGADTVSAHTRIALGERLSGWVAATTTPILNSDARLDLDPDLRDHSALQSALAVPISDGERLGGVLAFYSAKPSAFTPLHQRMAESVAALVAARVCAARAEMLSVHVV